MKRKIMDWIVLWLNSVAVYSETKLMQKIKEMLKKKF